MAAAWRTQTRRALASVPAVAVLACAELTGCAGAAAARNASTGQDPAVPAPAPARMTVCAHVRDVDRLTIDRVNLLPQNHEHFTFPALISVAGAVRSQAVARALCTLPVFPSGPIAMSCPVDLAISYVLRFTADDIKLAPVTVNATGCQQVSGLGQSRWTARTPAFWGVLGTAAGIAPADLYTFSGAPTS